MRRLAFVGGLATALATFAWAQEAPAPADVRSARPEDATFEGMWVAASRADAASDDVASDKLLQALDRVRVERNVAGVEVVALAQVAQGLERLAAKDADRAVSDFTRAIALDPLLPEGYLGRAKAELQQGPLGLVSAARDLMLGLSARLDTPRGHARGPVLAITASAITVVVLLVVFGLCMVLRYGPLLRHDIEEMLGGETRRPLALGLYATILLLPTIAQQGYAWLPIWWLAVLFPYLRVLERAVTVAVVVLLVAAGPLWWFAQSRLETIGNPLFRAAVTGIEGAGDARAIRELEQAWRGDPDDHDLAYLLACQLRKSGRYAEATAIYDELVRQEPQDGVAQNNLGNILAADGTPAAYAAAIAHYLEGLKEPSGGLEGASLTSARSARVRATLNYNLYLAYLLVFDFQRAQDARNQAEQADRSLVQDYERRWRVEKDGGSMAAFVDVTPTFSQCFAKFAGARSGVRVRNVMRLGEGGIDAAGLLRSLPNRLSAAVGVFVLVVVLRGLWRGKKAFTLICLKCGTPFCRRCHLGAAVAGLCTQCYHLFVVRDGVSGPARNQKLLEVQAEDERRERLFRVLSLLSPGAGHLYGQKTVQGLFYLAVWYFLVVQIVLSVGFASFSGAAGGLVGPWPVSAALLGMLVVYVLANRARLTLQVVVPVRRGAGRARVR